LHHLRQPLGPDRRGDDRAAAELHGVGRDLVHLGGQRLGLEDRRVELGRELLRLHLRRLLRLLRLLFGGLVRFSHRRFSLEWLFLIPGNLPAQAGKVRRRLSAPRVAVTLAAA
jgi:hypothetical protein